MTGLPRMSGAACCAALTWAGFSLKWQKGSHLVLRRTDPFQLVVVPNQEVLDRATLSAIVRQAGLTEAAFIELL